MEATVLPGPGAKVRPSDRIPEATAITSSRLIALCTCWKR